MASVIQHFFAPPDMGMPAGLFGVAHWLFLAITLAVIFKALRATCGMDARDVRRIIRVATLALWILEALKIAFVLLVVDTRNPNEYVPLYYCSITLYAGALSSLSRGVLRRVGDVFLATGGLVGGAVFLLVPLTSLSRYPAFHLISLHSFVLHGVMVYLGLLILARGVYRVRLRDILYNVVPVSVTCAVALLYNAVYDAAHPAAPIANLMFISKDFPGTPISFFYHLCGPFYPMALWLVQAFLPFLLVYGIQRAILLRRAAMRG